MATAKPNILLNSISGRLGSVVFYSRCGRQCVRLYVIPRNPDTEAQRAVRCAFGDAVRSWQSLSTDEKYSYTRKARRLNMSGYNLFISGYLKKVIQEVNPGPADKPAYLPCNLELSTWNSLPVPELVEGFPSVSDSSLIPYSINKPQGEPEYSPG